MGMTPITQAGEERELHKLDLYPFQGLIYNSKTRHRVVAAGRRTGKSHVMCVIAYDESATTPNRRVAMVGPTYGMARRAFWETLLAIVDHRMLSEPPRESESQLRFINGSRIQLFGADDPNKLRGTSPTPHLIILDEFAYHKPSVWTKVIVPMLADTYSRPRVALISTPNGKKGWLYRLWLQGGGKEGVASVSRDPEWESWQFKASEVRPDMAVEIEKYRNSMDPLSFAQEFEAEFENTGHEVFYAFDAALHCRDDLPYFGRGEAVHVAVDFNVGVMAASAFALRDVGGVRQVHFLHEWKGSRNTDELVRMVKDDFPGAHIRCYPDPSGRQRKTSAAIGKTDLSILRQAGFIVMARSRTPPISDSVNAVNSMLLSADGTTRLFVDRKRCPGLVESFEGTSWKEKDDEDLDTATIDKSDGIEHHTDGVRYAMERLFPVRGGSVGVVEGHDF